MVNCYKFMAKTHRNGHNHTTRNVINSKQLTNFCKARNHNKDSKCKEYSNLFPSPVGYMNAMIFHFMVT